MKIKWLILALIITSLFGYLEWSGGQHSFLYETEYQILSEAFTKPASFFHPFIILPFIGQLLLLLSLFFIRYRKWLIWAGMAGLTLLLGFMAIIGILSLNWKILLSVVPFFSCVVAMVITLRKNNAPTKR